MNQSELKANTVELLACVAGVIIRAKVKIWPPQTSGEPILLAAPCAINPASYKGYQTSREWPLRIQGEVVGYETSKISYYVNWLKQN